MSSSPPEGPADWRRCRPAAVHARKAHDDVLRVVRLHLEELAIVDDRADHLVHVVRLVRIPRE